MYNTTMKNYKELRAFVEESTKYLINVESKINLFGMKCNVIFTSNINSYQLNKRF